MGKPDKHGHHRIDPNLAKTYRKHYGFIWRNLRQLKIPDIAVDDTIHDIFMVAAQHLQEFEGQAAITN